MPEYISRETLRDLMYTEAFERDTGLQRWDSGLWIRYKLFENCIEAIPAADVVEVRHGRWERVGDCDKWICSECKEENLYAYSYGDDDYELQDFYCPSCGAKMDGEKDDV